jgi:hypothetical protein
MLGLVLIIIFTVLAIVGWWAPEKKGWVFKSVISLLFLVVAGIQIWQHLLSQNEIKSNLYTGTLSNEVLDSTKEILSAPKIYLGGKNVLVGNKTIELLNQFGMQFLVEYTPGTPIYVSTVVRNSDGNIIAHLIRNEWQVNRNISLDRNYSDNALEVIGQNGQVVLQVQIIDNQVRLKGIFFNDDGIGLAIGSACCKETGKMKSSLKKIGPGQKADVYIWPMFKYPSNLHFGELNQTPDPAENNCALGNVR